MTTFRENLRSFLKKINILKSPLWSRNVHVGLDMGDYSVKTAVVDIRKKRILNLRQDLLFPDRKSKDEIQGKIPVKEKLNSLVKDYRKSIPFFNGNVSAVVQSEHVVSHYIEIPKVSRDETSTAVESMAIKYIPFSLDKMIMVYMPVPCINKESKKTGVFFTAIMRDEIAEFKQLLEECGLEIENIKTPVLPLVNEFVANHAPEENTCYALINVGYKYTYFIVVRGRYPYFARNFSIGGSDFTYGYQMGKQISWQKAEELKTEEGIVPEEHQLVPFLVRWMDEIKRSMKYFENQFSSSGGKIEKIYLTGGTAQLRNFDNYISENLNIDIEVDGWNLDYAGDEDVEPSVFKMAVGLTFD